MKKKKIKTQRNYLLRPNIFDDILPSHTDDSLLNEKPAGSAGISARNPNQIVVTAMSR